MATLHDAGNFDVWLGANAPFRVHKAKDAAGNPGKFDVFFNANNYWRELAQKVGATGYTQTISGAITPIGGIRKFKNDGLLFRITHDAGDLSEYTSTAIDLGDLSAAAGAAMAGTPYGMQALVDDETFMYGQKDSASTSNILRLRFFFDRNDMALGDNETIYIVMLVSPVEVFAAIEFVEFGGTGLFVRGILTSDAPANSYTSLIAAPADPCYMEMLVTRASSATSSDGGLRFWVNGTEATAITGVDNYDQFGALSYIKFGAPFMVAPTASGTFYMDQIEVNESGAYIGPEQTIAGAATFSGAVTMRQVAHMALTAALTFAGTIARDVQKTFGGVLSFVGELIESTGNKLTLTGVLSFAGSITKKAKKSLAGTVTSSGTIARDIAKVLSGAITPAGALAKYMWQTVDSILSFSSTVVSNILGVIFQDGFESGDFAGWTQQVNPEDTLDVTAGSALVGTDYGMRAIIDDTTVMYTQYNVPSPYVTTDRFRARFYFNPSGLTMANDDQFAIAMLLNQDTQFLGAVWLGYTTAGGKSLSIQLNGDVTNPFSTFVAIPATGTVCIEFQVVRATGVATSDGIGRIWCNGTLLSEITDCDNFDTYTGIRYIRFGPISGLDVGTTGTAYYDEIVVNNDASTIGKLWGTSGAITPVGALIKHTAKQLSGAVSSAGALLKDLARTLSGTLSSAGALLKKTATTKSGSISPTATMDPIKKLVAFLAGTLTTSGTLIRSTSKGIAGSLSATGVLIKDTFATIEGVLSSAGALTMLKVFHRIVAGVLSLTGTLSKLAKMSSHTSSTLSFSGIIYKKARRIFSATLSYSGTVTMSRAAHVALTAALTFAGTIARGIKHTMTANVLSFVGAMVKKAKIRKGGVLITTGNITVLFSGLTGFVETTFKKMWRNIRKRM